MNSKENLIELFRGSNEQLQRIKDAIDDDTLSIYEGGYIDGVFMVQLLKATASLADTTEYILNRLNAMLGVGEDEKAKDKSKAKGAVLTTEEVMKQCTLRDNVVYLPKIQLNKKVYDTVKARIEEAGGAWMGGKVQGFVFPFDASRVFGILQSEGKCNLKKEFQFFETPAGLADWVVSLAGDIKPEDRVLEPSAGRGSIVKAIVRKYPDKTVDCYELMPENQQILSQVKGANVVGNDFMTEQAGGYEKIIANPPFANNQDIRHVRRMYDLLVDGGTLCAITSSHWCQASEKECVDFRGWLESVGGQTFEIDKGVFKESGTIVETRCVVIPKK